MKILVVSQHYAPEPFRLTDICETLIEMGHNVTVVTDVPNYPDGDIYDGYKKGSHRHEFLGGVKVHRTFTIPRKKNVVCRFLNYYSWRFSASKYLKTRREHFDVVLAYQTSPVMMAQPALDYSKIYGNKVVLYCLDIWPACLKAGGIKGGPIYEHYRKLSKKIYSSADKILVGSEQFKDYFKNELGIDRDDIEYMPQYAESLFTDIPEKKNTDGYRNIVFAGNVGSAQKLDTAIEAAEKTRDLDLRWHIVGDGSDLERIKKLASEKGLDNVIFHGRQPLESMPEYYSLADAMLLTLCDDDVISLTLPGKVQTYMAAKKPILASADGESKRVIEKAGCGFCTPAEDSDFLASSARKLCSLSDDELKILGENGYEYYNEHFAKNRFFDKLLKTLEAFSKNAETFE